MATVMCVCFFVAWTPYSVVSLLSLSGAPHVPHVLAVAAPFFAKSSTLYNPLVYFLAVKRFRADTRRLLQRLLHRCLLQCCLLTSPPHHRAAHTLTTRTLFLTSQLSTADHHTQQKPTKGEPKLEQSQYKLIDQQPKLKLEQSQYKSIESEPKPGSNLKQALKPKLEVNPNGTPGTVGRTQVVVNYKGMVNSEETYELKVFRSDDEEYVML
jgi:hypothetical protein